jgi:tetratricopeptide (TPR) repeat protein
MDQLSAEELKDLRLEAERLSSQNLLDEVLTLLNQGLGNRPNDPGLLSLKAGTLMRLARWKEAALCYGLMTEIQPDNASAWDQKGDALSVLNEYEQAIACYDAALRLEPHNASTLRAKALAEAASGHHVQALDCYDLILQSDPRDSAALIGRGDVLLSLRRYAEAIKSYEQAEKAVERSFLAPQWTARADSLVMHEELEEALRFYNKGIASDGRYFWARRGKGLVLVKLGKFNEAIRSFVRAARIDDRNSWVWIDMGNIFASMSKYAQAISCYQQASRLDSTSILALGNEGRMWQMKGEHEKAIELCERVLILDPENFEGWLRKGTSLTMLNREVEALKCYERILERSPDSLWAWNNKGWTHLLIGQNDQAIEAFDRAIELDRTEITPWANKARLFAKLNRLDEAIHCLDSACQVVRDTAGASLALANLLADYSELPVHFERSLVIFQDVLVETPGDYFTRANLVEVLVKLGRYKEAMDEAATVLNATTDVALRLMVEFLVLVSYALEGEYTHRTRQFEHLFDYFNSVVVNRPLGKWWTCDALIKAIVRSNSSAETKFLLLALLDVLLGRIPSASALVKRVLEDGRRSPLAAPDITPLSISARS